MPKASTESSSFIGSLEFERRRVTLRVSTDLARISAGLLVGVIALMTFLLSVGLQHPKQSIKIALYASLVTLGLSLLAYVITTLLDGAYFSAIAAHEGAPAKATKDELAQLEQKREQRRKMLVMARAAQQVLFVLSIIAVVGLAVAGSQLFFVTAATPTTSAG